MNNKELDDDGIEKMFSFQDLETYNGLEKIINEYPQNGLAITVARAYFAGLVRGKRIERKRNQNRLRRTGI